MLCYCVGLFIIPDFPYYLSECVDSSLKARDVVVLPGLVVGRVGDLCWAGDD